MTTNLKNIQKVAASLDNDLLKVAAELKRLQSVKCRLKKQPGKSSYVADMQAVLAQEEVLKQVRQLLDPKDKPVTMYDQSDVDKLDYDQTVKAIASIQSKKTNTKWLTTVAGDNDEYRQACAIERMLLAHKDSVQPVDDAYVRKTDLLTVVDTIRQTADISIDQVLQLLDKLL